VFRRKTGIGNYFLEEIQENARPTTSSRNSGEQKAAEVVFDRPAP
jgi:hypothetical protein